MPNSVPSSTSNAPPRVTLLQLLRKVHLYLGLFIAPALLFFAFTGAVQTLSLHEAAGTSYTPPVWLARLGQLHKNQNVEPRKPRTPHPQPPTASPEQGDHLKPPSTPPRPAETLARKEREHLPEKLFFLLVSLGLFSSTLTGIYMAYRYDRNRVLVTALLLAGLVIPLLLLPF